MPFTEDMDTVLKGQKPQSHGEHFPSLSVCAVWALNAKTKDCRKFK